MRSIFLNIFLWFWATVILTAIAVGLTFVLQPITPTGGWQTAQNAPSWIGASYLARAYERDGAGAANAILAESRKHSQLNSCLFDAAGFVLAGQDCEGFRSLVTRTLKAPTERAPGTPGRAALWVRNDQRTFIVATDLPHPAPQVGPHLAWHWLIALIVSGFICYLMTVYLTRPIAQLSKASRQIAGGVLSARAPEKLGRRRNELGTLVRDFNLMALRIEDLVSSQRQLVSDVSHELRSPLTRIGLCLDLARTRLGSDPAFERMALDLERLNTMIGRLLTMARLENQSLLAEQPTVDLCALLAEIVDDAAVEARRRNCTLRLEGDTCCNLAGDERLLRSGFENVVRNALHYTADGSEILVRLTRGAGHTLKVSVLDRGPGVPEEALQAIFKPFYRVADARDRDSGGAGLGLAIADRIMRSHGGRISAHNRHDGGLEIEIVLPAPALEVIPTASSDRLHG